MKTIRNPHRHAVADALREDVINHAYRANMNDSVIEGIRQVSDLWLLARRNQSLDDTMREVKVRESDLDISRITNDLRQSPEENHKPAFSPPEHAVESERDWVMV